MGIITAVTWVTDVVRVQSLAGELPHVECVAKKSEHIMPFAPTRMKLKSERKRQIPSGITYMWNLKHGTNEPFHKIETDSDIKNRLGVAKGER